jgi:pSer/pThr/pTyr-binding forkhead associated (FHA) protein
MSARCAYCDAELRPNSMFCFECGQLVQGATPPVPPGFAAPPAVAPQHGAAPAGQQTRPEPARPAVPLPPVWQPATTARPAEPSAVAPPTPPVGGGGTPPSSVQLAFSTGERVVVAGRAIIGRQPHSSAQNEGAQAIEVRDDTRSVSRVHLTVEVDERGVTIADAGSGNGSDLERNGVRMPLREGRPTTVHPGDRIWIGEVSIDLAFA